MNAFYWLSLGTLAVWRLTHLLQAEDGPGDSLARLRRGLGHGFWGSVLGCFYCLSLWVAIPFALCIGATWMERGLLWLACSAGAILLERLIHDRPTAAWYVEDKESSHELLPPDTGPLSERSSERNVA